MTVTIIGKQPNVERVCTGLWSLDHALKGGLPMRTMIELYGSEHVGKSTLGYYLAAVAGDRGVSLCDLEGFDPEYLKRCFEQAGYNGTVTVVDANDPKKAMLRTHEAMVQTTLTSLEKGKASVGILDSVGAFSPVAETEGDIGDANMGQAAKRIAQISRRATRVLNNPSLAPACFVVINHVHPQIGGMGKGHVTSGGQTLKYLAQLRMMIWPREAIKIKEEVVAYVIQGKIEKLRYGGKGGSFMAVNLAGQGVDRGLTAMIDCVQLGLATRGYSVKIGNDAVGRMATLIDAAKQHKDEIFQPFYETLAEYNMDNSVIVEGEEDGENDPADVGSIEAEELVAD